MMRNLDVLAVDFGASGGRGMLGSFDGEQLTLQEICRFANEPVRMGSHLHWDFPRLLHELGRAIQLAMKVSNNRLLSLAVDTWGVDFGLLDRDGHLVGLPYHYRDARTDGMMNRAFAHLPARQMYEHSGIQLMPINTVFQLFAMTEQASPQLDIAKKLLFTPDLFNYFLTGEALSERTIASTSGLMDARSREWSSQIMQQLQLPTQLFTPLVNPGTINGSLSSSMQAWLNVPQVRVIAGAAHDTAAAVASVPTQDKDYVYISSGTWSLMGLESEHPIISEESYGLGFTNESGVQGKTRFLKNIMGLWLIQQCRQQWKNEGHDYSYEQMQQMAAAVNSPGVFIDPDDETFLSPGNMPDRIQRSIANSGQKPLSGDKAEIIRCILESLALKYRFTLESLERVTGRRFRIIHIVGGGIQNRLLCKLTAHITGRTVVAGPIEATSIGNMLVQLMAQGELGSLSDLRTVVAQSFSPDVYEPVDFDHWADAYALFTRTVIQPSGDEHEG